MSQSVLPAEPPLALPPPRRLPPVAPGVRGCAAIGLAGLAAVLTTLDSVTGLVPAAWAAGVGCGVVLTVLVAHGLSRAEQDALSLADLVTLGRGLLACGVAALTAHSLLGAPTGAVFVVLAVPALALDAVDGIVARRTGTASPLGARLDGETDAFLILVLSAAAAPVVGWWVLAAGLARYAFGAAGWALPWLRQRLPYRYWRKVVTAVVGVALLATAARVLPHGPALAAALLALALLAESFGRDIWWSWRHRPVPDAACSVADAAHSVAGIRPVPDAARPVADTAHSVAGIRPMPDAACSAADAGHSVAGIRPVPDAARPVADAGRLADAVRPGRRRFRTGARVVVICVALALAWFAVLAPQRPDRLTVLSFLRLPAELLVIGALALVIPNRARRVVGALAGGLLGVLALAKVLDLVSTAVLDRPFEIVTDLSALTSGVSFVGDSLGPLALVAAVIGVLVLLGVLVVGLPWAMTRTLATVTDRRPLAVRALAGLTVGWLVCAVWGLGVMPGQPLAAAEVAPYTAAKVRATQAALDDRARFESALADDRFRSPASADLAGLRGKDVLVVFVESYGRVALDGPGSTPVRDLLDDYTARLAAKGYGARSAYLTSPTFGGSSWLAHSTLHAGVPVLDQHRYERLLRSERTTLSSAFARAGWRTAGVLPATSGSWPEGRAFYDLDAMYGRSDLGYAGPAFGFSTMPDQYALAAMDRLELSRANRPPVMATVELTSSHGPWAPLPTTVDPTALGDGSVFHGIRAGATTAAELLRDRTDVPAAYRTSIAYSLTSVLSFVERHRDDDLVVLMLGDHQPSTIVSGFDAGRDVPVTLLAGDPAVLEKVSTWGWQSGLRPDADAPVWPMASVRDRFLSAFSTAATR
ncbi:MAG: CDP-alcohol phosphatidyltransferase family protein [Dermatophilaceae bacterium]